MMRYKYYWNTKLVLHDSIGTTTSTSNRRLFYSNLINNITKTIIIIQTRCTNNKKQHYFTTTTIRKCKNLSNNELQQQHTNNNDKISSNYSYNRRLSSRSITHIELKDTLTIIKPQYRYLSPCWGAALSSSSSSSPVIGNMMRIGLQVQQQQQQQLQQVQQTVSKKTNNNIISNNSNLACKMFWQTDRWSPIQLSRKLSQPVSYLTPRLMGVLWYVATNYSLLSKNEMKHILHKEGIRSNYVNNTQWTGVSLSRWIDLIQSITNHPLTGEEISFHQQQQQLQHSTFVDTSSSSSTTTTHTSSEMMMQMQSFSIAPWLVGLWEICQTKQDLLEYLLALHEMYNGNVLDTNNEYVQAIVSNDIQARDEWISSKFTPDELTSDKINIYLDKLVTLLTTTNCTTGTRTSNYNNYDTTDHTNSYEIGKLFELICASRSVQHVSKPIVPNRKYSYDNGTMKSDCVEVSVRELLNLLLWDESKAIFDTSRLPQQSLLHDLYNKQEIQIQVPQQLQQSDDGYCINNNNNDRNENNNTTMNDGQAFFNVMSNRDGCNYLSTGRSGKQYELTPTLANIAMTTHQLLGLDSVNTATTGTTSSGSVSLEEFAVMWNKHISATTYKKKEDDNDNIVVVDTARLPTVHVSTFRKSYHQPLSEEMTHEEHATIYLNGATYGIVLKLEKARAISSVTHIRIRNDVIDHNLVMQLLKYCGNNVFISNIDPSNRSFAGITRTEIQLLYMALVGDNEIPQKYNTWTNGSVQNDHSNTQSDITTLIQVIGTRYGPDRRSLMELASTSDLQLQSKANKDSLRACHNVLLRSVSLLCHPSVQCDNKLKLILLSWLLLEKIQVIAEHMNYTQQQYSNDNIRIGSAETYLLQLDSTMVLLLPLQSTTWACYDGTLLQRAIQYKTGDITAYELLHSISGFRQMWNIFNYYVRISMKSIIMQF